MPPMSTVFEGLVYDLVFNGSILGAISQMISHGRRFSAMFPETSSKVAGCLPDIAGLTAQTSEFIDYSALERLRNGVFQGRYHRSQLSCREYRIDRRNFSQFLGKLRGLKTAILHYKGGAFVHSVRSR